jgi:hypothetical protein
MNEHLEGLKGLAVFVALVVAAMFLIGSLTGYHELDTTDRNTCTAIACTSGGPGDN